MLKSKFKKNDNSFMAQKIFTDREAPRDVFRNSILAYRQKPKEIIDYYGKGGIGKTSLIKKLLTTTSGYYEKVDMDIHNINISLDAYDYGNPVNILMSIRNGIVGDCSLFDYAVMQYCSKAKLTIEEIMNQNHFLSSNVMDILNEALNITTATACIPTTIMKKFLSVFKDYRIKEKFHDEITEMEDLNEFDIFERLPYYLGLCLSNSAEKKQYYVIFLDSYESMLKRTISTTPSVENEDWLKELFLSSSYIRIVIASRDKLGWDREDPEWNEYINSHLLNNLSLNDCKWFLENVPISDETIVDEIAKHSGGVPLYLDMCVDIYEDAVNSGREFDLASLEKGEKIIDRYIRHLDKKDKYAVKVLSALRCFDVKFAVEFLKKQNILFTVEELETLLEKSIFLPVESSTELWKVDESVRLHIRQKTDLSRQKELIRSILECIGEEKNGRMFSYFATVIEQILEDPDCLIGNEELVLEQVDYFANSGYWNELHTLLDNAENSPHSSLRAMGVYEKIIWCRRTGKLSEALKVIESCQVNEESMGVWFYMYRYLTVQIKHLMGAYDESIVGYKKLLDEMNLIRSEIPQHIYNVVCMKYADLLFLKGEFEKSLDIVENLLGAGAVSLEDKIELIRIKGHIYRFRKEYSSAELIYRSGLKQVENTKLLAYKGKLYTNMAETLCVPKPREALQWYEKAMEINGTIGNEIEIGKAKAAASVANTNIGDYNTAVALGLEAIAMAEKTGYKSGKAFGLAALSYAYKSSGESEKSSKCKNSLVDLIEEINVYRYICEVKDGED